MTALLLIWVIVLLVIVAEQRGQIGRLRRALREERLEKVAAHERRYGLGHRDVPRI